MSPALAGGFSTTEPPGKTLNLLFLKKKKNYPPENTFSLEEEDWVGRMLLQGECGRRGAELSGLSEESGVGTRGV